MASTGFILVTAGANNADAGSVAWSNPSNCVSSNDSRATSLCDKNTSQYLHATNPNPAVPAGSTINGIEVRIERSAGAESAWNVLDVTVQLIKAGSRVGSNLNDGATAWPGTDTNKDYGGSSNLWGTTWTAAEVNASNFGVAIRANCLDGQRSARVDAVWINIHYTEPKSVVAGAGSYAFTGTAATPKVARKTVAAAGAYTFTGATATLKLARKTVAAAGSYAFTGQTASPRRNLPLTAGAGSYAFTGQAATVRHGWNITASAGSYAFGGTAAGVLLSRKLGAGAGAYQFMGADATLIAFSQKIIGADEGGYLFAGSPAAIKAARLIAAATAAYTFSGQSAALIASGAPLEIRRSGPRFIANLGTFMGRR